MLAHLFLAVALRSEVAKHYSQIFLAPQLAIIAHQEDIIAPYIKDYALIKGVYKASAYRIQRGSTQV